ncbi:MAG: hypothetical protein ACFFA3_08335, partial [Promethearchaeota archaeon]
MSEIITTIFQSKGGELVYHKIVGQSKDLTIIYIHGLAPISPLFIEMFIEQYHKFSLYEYSFIIPNLIGFGDSEK